MGKNKKLKYIYRKDIGKNFFFQMVGYNLLERIDICVDIISGGIIELKADEIKQEY